MMERIRAVMNWSGGKDSAHALLRAQQSGAYDIVALLTTVESASRRSSMHGIPPGLLQAQAERIGIPLYPVEWTADAPAAENAAAMKRAVTHFKGMGVTRFLFGDIFLHDVRTYRERQLAPHGIRVVEPLWGASSATVMRDFLATGLRSVVVTTRADLLGADAIGREIDRGFIAALPPGVDPNGENGEYHTFCFDGPLFSSPVPYRLGATRCRSYDIRLDDGSTRTYTYRFAELLER